MVKEHFFYRIDGWFNYTDKILYDVAVEKAQDGDFIVEVGSHKGRSATAMAVNIINSGKKIKFYCIDKWENSDIYSQFLYNINEVSNVIEHYKLNSEDASKMFPDESLHFVYIDADHSYHACRKDIEIWYPKIKKGCVLGGHDYVWNSVKDAVHDFCSKNKITPKIAINNWAITK